MTDPFDILTVGCFLVTVVAFFVWTDHNTGILLRLLISVIAFAVANEIGRRGLPVFALALITAGAAYAVFVVMKQNPTGGRRG
jgi:hypothetical protein